MTKGKKRPGERRRVKKRRRQKKAAASFHRPREWAEQELIGVKAWLKRLRGSEGKQIPVGWRRGQIRHYAKRQDHLVGEIAAALLAEKKAKDEGDNGPNVA